MWEHRQTHPLDEERDTARGGGGEEGSCWRKWCHHRGRQWAQKAWERLEYLLTLVRNISHSNESVAEKSSLGRRLSLVLSSADQNTVGRLLPPAAVFLFFPPLFFCFLPHVLHRIRRPELFQSSLGHFTENALKLHLTSCWNETIS